MVLQSFPNPFNLSTDIWYSVPGPGRVTIQVFDLLGGRVEMLLDEHRDEGMYTIRWNAAGAASGLYLCRLNINGRFRTIKLLLQK